MITSNVGADGLKDCFRDPIPEIFEAASLIEKALSLHLRGDQNGAREYLCAADMPVIGEWLDSIWMGPNVGHKAIRKVDGLPPILPKAERYKPRNPNIAMKKALVGRDGFLCRLCGVPLIRSEVRKAICLTYPNEARWTGPREDQQHRGLQVMWLQYDHVVVHSRGGETSMENLVVTCPACNFGRDRFMMSEVGLRDPRFAPRTPSWEGWLDWSGVEGFLPEKDRWPPPAPPMGQAV